MLPGMQLISRFTGFSRSSGFSGLSFAAIVALSACPIDMLPLNGPDCRPRDVEYQILPA